MEEAGMVEERRQAWWRRGGRHGGGEEAGMVEERRQAWRRRGGRHGGGEEAGMEEERRQAWRRRGGRHGGGEEAGMEEERRQAWRRRGGRHGGGEKAGMVVVGFSRQIVALFKDHAIQYSSFDILSDEEVRWGLKTFSNWPTYPQVYVNGELVGGLDIVKELAESGELENTCPKAVTLEHRLKSTINRSPVMLFMKGNKEQAKCGFSRQILEIMNSAGVEYSTFDILEDEEELKESGDLPSVLRGEC
ncbi:unnamed protein product [Coregonus sp. 'balchen']|nr:unnamed protein product [Coregonus sp. 'balchen']